MNEDIKKLEKVGNKIWFLQGKIALLNDLYDAGEISKEVVNKHLRIYKLQSEELQLDMTCLKEEHNAF